MVLLFTRGDVISKTIRRSLLLDHILRFHFIGLRFCDFSYFEEKDDLFFLPNSDVSLIKKFYNYVNPNFCKVKSEWRGRVRNGWWGWWWYV